MPSIKLGPGFTVSYKVHCFGRVLVDDCTVNPQELTSQFLTGVMQNPNQIGPKGKTWVRLICSAWSIEGCRNTRSDDGVLAGCVVGSVKPKTVWKIRVKGDKSVGD
jgi:hypothetical protein